MTFKYFPPILSRHSECHRLPSRCDVDCTASCQAFILQHRRRCVVCGWVQPHLLVPDPETLVSIVPLPAPGSPDRKSMCSEQLGSLPRLSGQSAKRAKAFARGAGLVLRSVRVRERDAQRIEIAERERERERERKEDKKHQKEQQNKIQTKISPYKTHLSLDIYSIYYSCKDLDMSL